jgi:hypothetical protein
MRKIVIGSMIIGSLFAKDVTTVMPYYGILDYDDNSNKTAKKDGDVAGAYFSIGNLGYLAEFDYSKTTIKYKDSNIKDLEQDEFVLTYSKYYPKYMFKIGLHNIDTTDTDLGNGNTLIFAIGGYKWKGYDKYSYGLETFYSMYPDGYDEKYTQKDINIIQLTPYFGFSKAININTRNNIDFKINYIQADDYKTKDYTSYEVSNTLFYKKFFTTIKAYGGEMKTGVKSGGSVVYNSKDLLKSGYGINMGYYIKPNFKATVGYSINNYTEYGKTEDTTNSLLITTLNYSF